MPLKKSMDSEKAGKLAILAAKRKASRWPGYRTLADYHSGAYECDFVSPYSKTAGNVDSSLFIMLQDWSSDKALSGPLCGETVRLGYTPDVATNRNLQAHLQKHFDVSLSEIYATNLFPFIKYGGMSAKLIWNDTVRAATIFALPQIAIVQPRLAIALGLSCFNASRIGANLAPCDRLINAIREPFEYAGASIWCQAHTGWGAGHRGNTAQITEDWKVMADWYRSEVKVHFVPN